MGARHRIVLVTGLSGGGKSTAIKALEDAGWFCIDNLPVVLLPKLLELAARGTDEIERFALVVDARESRYLAQAPAALEEVRRAGHRVEVVFLECSDEALQRRFSETRRRHPLSSDGSVEGGISAERKLLEPLRQLADQIIDTTRMTVHELRAAITTRFGATAGADALSVTLLSFGFRNGLPAASDYVFDVRFLPNPYFVPELRELTGVDARVSSYVLEKPLTQELLTHLESLLSFLLPHLRAEGKSYLTISLGCTGGQHRSVALVEELKKRLELQGARVNVSHRDLAKG